MSNLALSYMVHGKFIKNDFLILIPDVTLEIFSGATVGLNDVVDQIGLEVKGCFTNTTLNDS